MQSTQRKRPCGSVLQVRDIDVSCGAEGRARRIVTPVFAPDRKSTRLNSSHLVISYAVFCLKKKKNNTCTTSPCLHWWRVARPTSWYCGACTRASGHVGLLDHRQRSLPSHVFFFFFNDTATTEIYTLSLHDALPI